MKCPFCHYTNSKVKDSRLLEDGYTVKRRRVCEKCEGRFTTLEKIKTKRLMVIKSSGQSEPFNRNKVSRSLLIAANKRPLPITHINLIIDEMLADIEHSKSTKISSKFIGQTMMQRLFKIDYVAYIRFASVHMDFKNIEDFMKAINDVSNKT